MTWKPDLTVTIGGTSYTSSTVDSVQVSYGRSNVWEQARTGYATITLVQFNETYLPIEINESVTVTMDNSSGASKTIFTGTVNNFQSRRAAQGLIQGVTYHTITAVGPFAKMSRTEIAGSNYPKEDDDIRMNRILTDAGVTIDVVDTPAVYELMERPGNLIDAYTLGAQTANELFGYIYETTDGKVGYANQSRRLNEVQDNGYFEIPKAVIQWNSISTSRNLGNLLNSLTLEYRAGTVTSSSAGSISTYGLAAGKITTTLHDVVDAQNLADFFVATRSNPQTNISTFSVALESGLIADAKRDALIETYLGKPISITSLPLSLYDDTYTGFVEGWTLAANREQAVINLTTTDATFSLVPTRWQDVDPATDWTEVDVTIKWFEYE